MSTTVGLAKWIIVLSRTIITFENKLCYLSFVQFLKGLSQGHQHSRIIWTKLLSLLVIVKTIEMHFQDLIRLTKAVPSPIVTFVDLYKDRNELI